MNINLIHRQWVSYLESVVPENTPSTQVLDIRNAFYAGVYGLNSILNEIADNDALSDEVKAKIFVGLNQEMLLFRNSIDPDKVH